MMFDPNTWYLIAFVIFIGLLGRTLWRIASQLLDGKINTIRKNLKDAARMKTEAEDFLELSKKKQKEAQEQARKILDLSEREVQRIQQDALQERKEFLISQERQLEERLASLEMVAFKELNETIIHSAIASAEKVIQNNIDQPLDSALIQETIKTADSLRLPAGL